MSKLHLHAEWPLTVAQHLILAPKKSFGQNFLINEAICARIVESFMQAEPTGRILEIGPGKGALTRYLSDHPADSFKAVEADRTMAEHLINNEVLQSGQLIQGDFLKLPLERVFDKQPFSVIGNFPYNISSQILFRIDKYKDLIPLTVGMFQKEVAERIVAREGSKTYGVTSVLLGAAYDSSILFHVKPGNFFPVPKVTSSVVMLQRKGDYSMPCDPKLFRSVVKSSFGQRRKMLRNSLKSFITDPGFFDKIVMTKRPEQLSIEEFYTLTNQIQEQ
jgi:16S rRNA (adenine1518-N6/adenine1519-N6)-dimethyltransferase